MSRICNRCGHKVEVEKEVKGYPYYCPNCDENMFECETHEDTDGTPANKRFTVDVKWGVHKEYELVANSPEEAKAKVEEIIRRGCVCVWDGGFEATDDVSVEVVSDTPVTPLP